MKRALALLSILVLGVGSAFAGRALADTPWESVADEDGIHVWRREREGSPLVAFKGEALVQAPIARVAMVLHDNKRAGEWVADAVEFRIVEQISPAERIEYNRTTAPWPVKDRDFVFRACLEVDPAHRTLLYRLRSVVDPRVPEDDDKAVRGELTNSSYLLEALDDSRTRVTVEIECDPRGSIPKWVVNLAQKGWPRATLEGIRRQVAKPDVLPLAWIDDALAGKGIPGAGKKPGETEGLAVAAVSSDATRKP